MIVMHRGGRVRPNFRPVRSGLWAFSFFCFSVLINQGGQSTHLHGRPINGDLGLEAVVMPVSINPFYPPLIKFLY
jgi:hypothetical protein